MAQSTTIFSPDSRSERGKVVLVYSTYRIRLSSTRVARPIFSGCASTMSPATSASISASASSDSLNPSGPKNLMPLSRKGLWLAEIITPRSARMEWVR